MASDNSKLRVGSLAPDATITVKTRETTVHEHRGGAPMLLVFLRHLR